MELSASRLEYVRRNCAEQLSQVSEGKDPVDIAARMYSDSYPEKSLETAVMVARQMEKTVVDYHENLREAVVDYDGWLEKTISRMTVGMDDVAAYNQLYQTYVAMLAIAADPDSTEQERAETAQWLKRESRRTFEAHEVTEEKTKQLRENLAEALGEASLPMSVLDEIAVQMEGENAVAVLFAQLGGKKQETEVVLAMEMFLEARNGVLGKDVQSIQPEMAAISVCAAVETYAAVVEQEEGKIVDTVDRVLNIVSGVITVAFCALISVLANAEVLTATGEILAFSAVYAVAALIIICAVSHIVENKERKKIGMDRLTKAGREKSKAARRFAKERMENSDEYGGTITDDEENDEEENYAFA